MRNNAKIILIAIGVIAVLISFVVFSEYSRRQKLAEAAQAAETHASSDSAALSPAAAAAMPGSSQTLVLMPNGVQIWKGTFSGPRTLQVRADAQQKMVFGLVPKSQVNHYNNAKTIGAEVEKLPCSSGGVSGIVVTCDLTADDKDLTLVVADVRTDLRAALAEVNDKKRVNEPQQFTNLVTFTVTATNIPATPR